MDIDNVKTITAVKAEVQENDESFSVTIELIRFET
jgi:hypothetical protein